MRRDRVLVIGSFNAAKAREMAELLVPIGVPLKTLRDFPEVKPVPETGSTFAENSRLKALGFARQISDEESILGVVAEDSGLEVDALGGRPGVLSARYVSEQATDRERVLRILQELEGLPRDKRTARFCCHVTFADARGVILETEGVVEGRIALRPAGEYGFGYDPIFIPDGYDRTFGELGYTVKHRISHRAVALAQFCERFRHLAVAQESNSCPAS